MRKRVLIAFGLLAAGLAAALALSGSLLATVLVSGFLDGIHPCGIGVLLFFLAFLLSLKCGRKTLLAVGGAYIAGVFLAYFSIGLGIMKALTFVPPMLMAKAGAGLLVVLALVTIKDALTGSTTVRMPSFSKPWIQQTLSRATIPAALAAGFLVGLCAFPCAGGIYVAIIGLLASHVDVAASLAYLLAYNIAFVAPLALLLFAASTPAAIVRIEGWEKRNRRAYKLAFAAFMLVLAALIYGGAIA